MATNKHDSGVLTVNGCLTEGGNSIFGDFSCEPLGVKLPSGKMSNEFLGLLIERVI